MGADSVNHEPADGWMLPPPGTLVRQTIERGAFVVQRREDMGWGGVRLIRHAAATATIFEVLAYTERPEIGMSCHVVILRDTADDAEYVVDCGLMGPGLPEDSFAPVARRKRKPAP